VSVAAAPETLARRRGRCRLCHEPIVAGHHYVTKLDRLGWVHSECGSGYRQVIAEHADDAEVDDG
jgi:hypothetical protein